MDFEKENFEKSENFEESEVFEKDKKEAIENALTLSFKYGANISIDTVNGLKLNWITYEKKIFLWNELTFVEKNYFAISESYKKVSKLCQVFLKPLFFVTNSIRSIIKKLSQQPYTELILFGICGYMYYNFRIDESTINDLTMNELTIRELEKSLLFYYKYGYVKEKKKYPNCEGE